MSCKALLRCPVIDLSEQLSPFVNASWGKVPWNFVYIDGRIEVSFSFLAPPLQWLGELLEYRHDVYQIRA
jgi:hypothetical protein